MFALRFESSRRRGGGFVVVAAGLVGFVGVDGIEGGDGHAGGSEGFRPCGGGALGGGTARCGARGEKWVGGVAGAGAAFEIDLAGGVDVEVGLGGGGDDSDAAGFVVVIVGGFVDDGGG